MEEEAVKKIAELEGKMGALTSQIETLEEEKGASGEEVEGLKEELKGVNEELSAYENEGKTVEEQHELALKKKDEEIQSAKDETKKERELRITSEKKSLREKVLSDFKDVNPSWIKGETEEELRKSAGDARRTINDIVKKKMEEAGMDKSKWNNAPGPGAGGGGGGPVAPDDQETIKNELEAETAKGAQSDVQKIIDLKFKLGKMQSGQK